MTEQKKAYPIKHLVNWYIGNHCSRKCFDKMDKLEEHQTKLLEFAEKNQKLQMTHRDFLDLFNNHITICTLDESFKQKSIGWKLFTVLQRTQNYNSDEIIVKDKIITTKSSPLEQPKPGCIIC